MLYTYYGRQAMLERRISNLFSPSVNQRAGDYDNRFDRVANLCERTFNIVFSLHIHHLKREVELPRCLIKFDETDICRYLPEHSYPRDPWHNLRQQ